MLAIAAKSIGSIAAIHITLSGICIANSALYQGKIMTSSKSKTDTQKDTSVSAAMTKRIVQSMYNGHGINPNDLSPGCMFVDPIAICVGRDETIECFRALKFMSPKTSKETTLAVKNIDGDLKQQVLMELQSEYFSSLNVTSLLIVNIDRTGNHPVVTKFEEQWNYIVVLNSFPFNLSRRFYGILSCFFTPLVLRD